MSKHQVSAHDPSLVERFQLAGQEGYSDYWRRDKSPIEILELAKALRGIRKICSYVGRNIGQIVWSGMQRQEGLSLDPSVVLGEYPIPAARTDVAVGLGIHQAYQISEWSERFKNMATVRLDLPKVYAYKYALYFSMAEKVYADLLSNRSVLGLYTEKARDWEWAQRRVEFIQPPTITEVLHIWWRMAAQREGEAFRQEYVDRSVGGLTERTSLEKFYRKPLALLNSLVEPLRDQCPRINGVSERGLFRIELYNSIWPQLLERIKFWPGDRSDPFLLHDKFKEELEKEEEERRAVKSTIISFAQEIEKAVTTGTTDFTDQVKSLVKNQDQVVRIEGNDVVMAAGDKVDRKLLNNLRMVLQSLAHHHVIHNRGLQTGKIDRRRLYRAPTTGAVFQIKKHVFELQNDFVLLVDCTGSMAGPVKWDYTESLYQTLFTALKSFTPRTRIFAYNEVRGACHLTEIFLGGRFYSVLPHGKTASGEAIIATALSLKRNMKRPFIVHITDGASNWGCGVADAIRLCASKRINLLTLGLGCDPSNKEALRREYGKLVQFVDNLAELPRLFGSLLGYSKWH